MSPREYAPLLAAALAILALSVGAATFDAARGLDGSAQSATEGDVDEPRSGSGGRSSDSAADSTAAGDADAADRTSNPRSDGSSSAPLALTLVACGLLAATALLRRLAAGDGGSVTTADGEQSDPTPTPARDPPTPAPTNGVAAAWLALARRVAGTDWHHRTPDEVAAAARDEGLPPDAVDDIHVLFERVRYGGEPATPERERRADAALERLRGGDAEDV